jgi:MFS family permease
VATDKNFKKLLSFNSFWVFALNLVSPFFSVYMMKTLGLEVPVILCLGVLGQLIGIFFVKLWGKNADRFGNKTVIGVCVPIYILCLLAWTAVGSLTSHAILIPILALIHIFSNIATAGINLSLTNIGLKLSPSGGAIAYLAAKNMFTSVFSASAPLIAGMLADSMNLYKVDWAFNIGGVHITAFHVEGFGFFFLAAAIFAVFSLRLLRRINEDGASKRRVVLRNIGVQINEAFELKRKSA